MIRGFKRVGRAEKTDWTVMTKMQSGNGIDRVEGDCDCEGLLRLSDYFFHVLLVTSFAHAFCVHEKYLYCFSILSRL